MADKVKCDICHKPFEYGDQYVHLQQMVVGQSQGYEDHFAKFTVNCCKDCVIKGLAVLNERNR